MVYLAPMKALCEEKHGHWEAVLKPLGVTTVLLTGDVGFDVFPRLEVERADIMWVEQLKQGGGCKLFAACGLHPPTPCVRPSLTTPEKWYSLTRQWRDNVAVVNTMALLLVDEVHLVGEPRGATLEAVISRMVSVVLLVCVCVSAFLPKPSPA